MNFFILDLCPEFELQTEGGRKEGKTKIKPTIPKEPFLPDTFFLQFVLGHWRRQPCRHGVNWFGIQFLDEITLFCTVSSSPNWDTSQDIW